MSNENKYQCPNHYGERLMKLETRLDNHEFIVKETKDVLKDIQKDQRWQTKQIFMGIGGLGVLVFIIGLWVKLGGK